MWKDLFLCPLHLVFRTKYITKGTPQEKSDAWKASLDAYKVLDSSETRIHDRSKECLRVPGGSQLFPSESDDRRMQHQGPPNSALERKPIANEPFVPEPLLNTDQAAAIMRIHPKTLQKYARKGVVRGFQLGTMWRFRASEIDRWISERIAS